MHCMEREGKSDVRNAELEVPTVTRTGKVGRYPQVAAANPNSCHCRPQSEGLQCLYLCLEAALQWGFTQLKKLLHNLKSMCCTKQGYLSL